MSLNLYTYYRNNPLVYVDPSGHSYGTLPDGTKFSINSNWDAKKFYELRDKQLTQQAEQAKQAKQKLLDDRIKAVPQAQCNDYYDTIDEAAIDFVLMHNKNSILYMKEYGAEINRIIIDDQEKYVLSDLREGWRNGYEGSVDIYLEENSVAYVHTHGHYACKENNYFSVGPDSDISITYSNNSGHSVIAYVGVPNGNILKFDPEIDIETDQFSTGNIIFELAPIDPNDPKWKVE